jgi:hypothetical protein
MIAGRFALPRIWQRWKPAVEIVTLQQEHLEDAERMVSARHRLLRRVGGTVTRGLQVSGNAIA